MTESRGHAMADPLAPSHGSKGLESLAAELARQLGQRATMDSPDAFPVPSDVPRAAVALVLRDGDEGPELLLIKRADRDDDPWSGHVALPGGREEPGDATLQATAVRETREETGIDLDRDGAVLGALDALLPRSAPVAVAVQPFVAALHRHTSLVLSEEVAAAFWVPLAVFAAAGAATESVVRVRGQERRVPSFRHGDYVVWGLTERMIRQFLDVLAKVRPRPAGRHRD